MIPILISVILGLLILREVIKDKKEAKEILNQMKKKFNEYSEDIETLSNTEIHQINEYLLEKEYVIESCLGQTIYRKGENVIKVDPASPENSSTKLKVTFYSMPPYEFGIKKEAAFVINTVEELKYILNTLLK